MWESLNSGEAHQWAKAHFYFEQEKWRSSWKKSAGFATESPLRWDSNWWMWNFEAGQASRVAYYGSLSTRPRSRRWQGRMRRQVTAQPQRMWRRHLPQRP